MINLISIKRNANQKANNIGRYMKQWNRIESTEINQIYMVNWFLTKVFKPCNMERIVPSANGAGATRYLQVKEWNWTCILQYI